MNSRKERVLPEPSLSEPHVVISVRDPCTCKVRLFKENSYFMEVLEKAAKVALIKGPHFLLQSLVRGMGNFWEKLCPIWYYHTYIAKSNG